MQANKKMITGLVKRSADGFGFLIPDQGDHPDVYIPRHSMEGVMTSDRVMVQVEAEKGGDRFRGEILKIIERGFKRIVGQFTPVDAQHAVIVDESKGWGSNLKIRSADSLNARRGELVAAQILTYPDDPKGFYGKVIEVLGNAQNPMNDIRRVLLTNNIPHEFSPACLNEAKNFDDQVHPSEFSKRRDLRDLNLITIDGATAKDFDDAVHVKNTGNGFLLHVAIADVSHYVRVGSAIDKDAYERGTSVYYPNHVTPMLPEVLSNGLCSLLPRVPRLALVAEMHFSFAGELVKSEFYEAVIESKARVTYGEAQEILDGNPIEKLRMVSADIHTASDLAKILMARRFREGSLDLEIPETQLVVDAGGNPIDIVRSERLFAHRLIEELMLAANVAVAKFFEDKRIPALYRVHDQPNVEAIAVLEKYLQTFGGRVQLRGGMLQKRLTKALQEFAGKPQATILNILTLRSMAQAKYSPNNIGHFGLGFQFYTHFTSPIRRYPDLMVHRLIKNLIMPNSQYRLLSEEDLNTAGVMLSACEQRAVKSERLLVSIKKARFMEKFVGQEMEGVISSVARFGAFVLLRGYEVDGLIRLESMGPGYEYNEDTMQLYNRRTGHSYSIGDPLKIFVESVDVELGQINFTLPGAAPRIPGVAPRTPGTGPRTSGGGSRAEGTPRLNNKNKASKHRGGSGSAGKPAKPGDGRNSKKPSRRQRKNRRPDKKGKD